MKRPLTRLAGGGAAVQANIWPAALRGTGFYQKLQTDHILRADQVVHVGAGEAERFPGFHHEEVTGAAALGADPVQPRAGAARTWTYFGGCIWSGR
jgi:hypothetical protein